MTPALLSTSQFVAALVVIIGALVTVTKYVLIPFSKACIAGYRAYLEIAALRREIEGLRKLVGQNGAESVFQMLHLLRNTQTEHSQTLKAQNNTLEKQNQALANQDKVLAEHGDTLKAMDVAMEKMMPE